jgi:hypothetical protein
MSDPQAGAVPPNEWRNYTFFVDDQPYATEHRTLTSMEIKHIAGVPLNERLGHEIGRRFREGHPLFLSDAEPIDLAGEPKRFYAVPQAYASGPSGDATAQAGAVPRDAVAFADRVCRDLAEVVMVTGPQPVLGPLLQTALDYREALQSAGAVPDGITALLDAFVRLDDTSYPGQWVLELCPRNAVGTIELRSTSHGKEAQQVLAEVREAIAEFVAEAVAARSVVAPREDLRELLAEAYEAGHGDWPTPDHPTRASQRDAAIAHLLKGSPHV